MSYKTIKIYCKEEKTRIELKRIVAELGGTYETAIKAFIRVYGNTPDIFKTKFM